MGTRIGGPKPPVIRSVQRPKVSSAANSARFSRLDRIRDILLSHPGVKSLGSVIENNMYHVNCSVLAHTLKVAEEGRGLLNLGFISNPAVVGRFSSYMEVVVDPSSQHQFTRSELVYAAMYLHDLGKGMNDPKSGQLILQTKDDGNTTAFKHAAVGAPKAEEIAKEALGLSEAEAKFIRDIVTKHMDLFSLESALNSKPRKGWSREDHMADLTKKSMEKIGYNPLTILHTIADLAGSDHDASASQTFLRNLIVSLFIIGRVRLNPNHPPVGQTSFQVIDSLAKKHGVILVPAQRQEEFLPRLEAIVRAEFEARAAAGKISAGKVEGITRGMLGKLTKKFEFRPGELTADAVEAGFDFNQGLAQNPVILEIIVEAPRPEIG